MLQKTFIQSLFMIPIKNVYDRSTIKKNVLTKTVTPKNLYRYKLGKIIMTEICIGISYGK